ncbi:MAG: glycosyltransferase family 4 protein [Polyangiales bacterium]
MTEPLRVLFLNDTARNGGPGRSLHTILSFLDPAEVHRTVLLPREDVIADLLRTSRCAEDIVIEPDLIENPFQPRDRAVERDDLDAPWTVRGPRLALNVGRLGRLSVTLPRLVRERRVDVVYCNGTTADFVGAAVALRTGVPAVWHVRYTSVPAASKALHHWLSSRPEVARIVCVSRAAASLFPHCPEKVAVIHNAVDLGRFERGATPGCFKGKEAPADAFVFGSMGRVLPRKGYPQMIRAAKVMLERATEEERRRVRFVVVGDTPADIPGDHLGECRSLVKACGLEGVFLFPGFTADVRPWVEDFDVVVLPSVYPDPLPRTVIEGMAYGCPVVAFDVGGVGEMVRSGETGALLPESTTPEALADVMLGYLRDPARVAREGRCAREVVVEAFDARQHARKIHAQIVEAAKARRR